MAINYADCDRASTWNSETNDCTVKALAIVAQVPYIKAHDHMAKNGRRFRKGWRGHVPALMGIYEKLSLKAKATMTTAKTMKQFEEQCDPTKTYCVFTRGHIVAVRNGKVQDWTAGRRHRPQFVFEITRTQSKNAQRKAKRYGA